MTVVVSTNGDGERAPLDVVPAPPVQRGDEVVDLLSRSFALDPCFSWIFPDESRRADDLRLIFRSAWADIARHGASWKTADGAGAALWTPPGRAWDDEVMAPFLAEMADTYRSDDFGRLGAFFGLAGEQHPAEPHYYLGVLGADPARQGQGIGSALLTRGLEVVDQAGMPAYLESSNGRNVRLYERFGFHVTAEIDIPGGGSSGVVHVATPTQRVKVSAP